MRKPHYILLITLFVGSISTHAQNTINGTVFELDKSNKKVPLPMANVFWLGTTIGTITNEKGEFSLQKPQENNNKLVARFLGYKTDTIEVEEAKTEIQILLLPSAQNLQDFVIEERQESSFISKLNTMKTEVITTDGLCRLACCNLAESFENSATVDVGYSDAVSGARQIQMLGLTGIYSQMLLENIPFIKGLSAPFGLSYVPGSFMESIQISKGVASVINGYETVTGQINIEYKKPNVSDLLFVNGYFNNELKGELNALSAHQFNDKLSTMLFAHGSYFNQELDHVGNDGFIDYPKLQQLNLVNRWFYNYKKYTNITLVNYVTEKRTGGEIGFNREMRAIDSIGLYGIGIDNNRLQLFTKNGIMINDSNSIGLQISGTYFQQKAFYGLNNYIGNEANIYTNLIYETTFANKHKINTGASFQLNKSNEDYRSLNIHTLLDTALNNEEVIPGIFAQYNYTINTFTLTTGVRYDYNSTFDASLLTPRLHLKWEPTNKLTIRGSAGKGYRTAYILAENFGLMASSRKFVFSKEPLEIENAWNYGFNIVQEFKILKKNSVFTLDFYRTDFLNQVIVDLDKNAHEVHFYNLKGQSYSNSLQADLTVDILKGFKVTLAGRYNDVKSTTNNTLQEKVYSSKWKALLVMSYATKYDKWIFDLTTQLNGPSRLPNTNNARPNYSNSYIFMLGQITRKFKHIDIYAGCENITNHVQKDPIIAASQPFSKEFDASVIYAPMMSRLLYIGFRFKIQ